MRSVAPGYFELLQIPLRAGRLFTDDDSTTAPPVMIVSESYGRQHFGSANPVGQLMDLGDKPVEIVGVVGDVRYAEVSRDAAPAFYVPRAQSPVELICLLVKPQPGMSEAVATSLRGAVRAVDPEQPAEGLTTVGEIISQSTADRRFYALATGLFATVALALAIAGLFGVVSRAVTERRRELAIRTAIGADARHIVRLVLGYGLIPVAIGTTVGGLVSLAGARLLRRLLFGVPPTDGLTYLVCITLVIAVATGACLLPARRALRFEPASLLRE
jgi:ABC-type antimicrobial peptide transport system permease subunit